MTEYLRLSDLLGIARICTGIEPEDVLANDDAITAAEGALYAPLARSAGVEQYADLQSKAAALAYALIRARPMPRRNIEVAHECMKEFLYRNGMSFDKSRSAVDAVSIWQAIINDEAQAWADLVDWVYACAF